MLKGGYSDKFKKLQRRNSDPVVTSGISALHQREAKVKELSKETNRRRRDLAEKKKQLDIKEEKRRQRVLSARREQQRDATERFQKFNGSAVKRKCQLETEHRKGSDRTLKDGVYIIGEHTVEIKDGRRIYHPPDFPPEASTPAISRSISGFIAADGKYVKTERRPELQVHLDEYACKYEEKQVRSSKRDKDTVGNEMLFKVESSPVSPTWQSGQSYLQQHVNSILQDFENAGKESRKTNSSDTEHTQITPINASDNHSEAVSDNATGLAKRTESRSESATNKGFEPASYTLHVNGKSRQMPLYRSVSADNVSFADSLDLSDIPATKSPQVPLKSNLRRIPSGRKVQRRVTFSDSVEFDDGNGKPVVDHTVAVNMNNASQPHFSPTTTITDAPVATSDIIYVSSQSPPPTKIQSGAPQTPSPSLNNGFPIYSSPTPEGLCYPDTVDLASPRQANVAVISPLKTNTIVTDLPLDIAKYAVAGPTKTVSEGIASSASAEILGDYSLSDSLEVRTSECSTVSTASLYTREEEKISNQQRRAHPVAEAHTDGDKFPRDMRMATSPATYFNDVQQHSVGVYSPNNNFPGDDRGNMHSVNPTESVQRTNCISRSTPSLTTSNTSATYAPVSRSRQPQNSYPIPKASGTNPVLDTLSNSGAITTNTFATLQGNYAATGSNNLSIMQKTPNVPLQGKFISQNDVVNYIVDDSQQQNQGHTQILASVPNYEQRDLHHYSHTNYGMVRTVNCTETEYMRVRQSPTVMTSSKHDVKYPVLSHQAYNLINEVTEPDEVCKRKITENSGANQREGNRPAKKEARSHTVSKRSHSSYANEHIIPDSSDSSDDDNEILIRARNSMAELNFSAQLSNRAEEKADNPQNKSSLNRPFNIPGHRSSPTNISRASEISNDTVMNGSQPKQKSNIPLRIHSSGRRFASSGKDEPPQTQENFVKQSPKSFVPHPPRVPKSDFGSPTNLVQMGEQHRYENEGRSVVNPVYYDNNIKVGWDVNSNVLQGHAHRGNIVRSNSAKSASPSLQKTTQTAIIPQRQAEYFLENRSVTNQRANPLFIPLDKTPTDEDINVLWENVRNCLHSTDQEVAYSDSAYIKTSPRKHYNTYHNARHGPGIGYIARQPGPGSHVALQREQMPRPPPTLPFRRYGSQENLRRQNSLDNLISRQDPTHNARLTQRARSCKQVINTGSNHRGPRYSSQGPSISSGMNREVSDSLASFLEAESKCNQEALPPNQTQAVFQASHSLHQKIASSRRHEPSALSIEERKAIESLERLNLRLRDQEALTNRLMSNVQGNNMIGTNNYEEMQYQIPDNHRPVIMDASKRRQYSKSASTRRPPHLPQGRKAGSAR